MKLCCRVPLLCTITILHLQSLADYTYVYTHLRQLYTSETNPVWSDKVFIRLHPVLSERGVHNSQILHRHSVLEDQLVLVSFMCKPLGILSRYFNGRCRVDASAVEKPLSSAKIISLLRYAAAGANSSSVI